jgi:two-component system, NtrC family, response regulator AtoC
MTQQDVLIVDDEPQMLIAMNETVKRTGFSVATAGSGVEALEKIKSCHYRMVITDLRMPVVSGLELLKEVKYSSPRTQVILVTAHGTVNNAVEAMKMGAFDYLLKPFSADDLRSVVQRAIQKNESFLTVQKAHSPFPIVTQDPDMRAALELAEQAARGKATILIQAESGTGKELVARSIHQLSPRKDGPFVAVNCAALPDNLLEAELFGHEKGAFTGAIAQKLGKFELANRGTLLLDEIGEMVPLLQAKLLRVLQEKEIDRVGGKNPIPVDVRVIATTNKDLKTLVQNGTFREDLYYRLNVIPLGIPPLRKRRDDVGLLAAYFCEKYGMETHNLKMSLAPETLELLTRYDWPGNVRELENVMQRATSLAGNSVIYPKDLRLHDAFRALSPQTGAPSVPTSEKKTLPTVSEAELDTDGPQEVKGAPALDLKAGCSVSEMEKQLIQITLAETNGNRTHAARLLGISLRTLRNKLREYRLAEELVGVEVE